MQPSNPSQNKIPISILIATRNEEGRIEACLKRLQHFDEIILIDSNSTDQTYAIAAQHGAQIHHFTWNNQYPKKRQWILDNISTKHNWILFLDADELMTEALEHELRNLFQTSPPCAGYFIKAHYIWNNKQLKHGLQNNKLCLFDRSKFDFPEVNDLEAPGMGEIEGHYQPVLKPAHDQEKIGYLKASMLHKNNEDPQEWKARHQRYAAWEHYMNTHNAWPNENSKTRSILKALFRTMPARPLIAYLHSFLLKGGILDGAAGHDFAKSRMRYYQMIKDLEKGV